jgi:chorismate mutase
MNSTQNRVTTVLNRMIALTNSSAQDARMFSDALESTLNDIRNRDGFGSEAQSDFRGDGRNGSWSMNCVEGIDNCDGVVDSDNVQKRVELVLERMTAMARADEYDADMLREGLNSMLDELKEAGYFGDAGEADPRGGVADDAWPMAQVLDHLIALTRSSVRDAQAFSDALDEMLDELRSNDGFGTEAQSDPRGDGRDGDWSMTYVEGIDGREDMEAPDALVQQRVCRVIERMADEARTDENNAEGLAHILEDLLNELKADDGFGSEAENDPRGDFRNGQWDMGRVEGVDA